MAQRSIYYIDVRHDGLNRLRRITGSDRALVEEKANRQLAAWNEQWERKQAALAKREARAAVAQEREERKELAAEHTAEANEAIAAVEGILSDALAGNRATIWDSLKDTNAFDVPRPNEPRLARPPTKPEPDQQEFLPRLGLMDRLIPKRRARREREAAARFQERLTEWEAGSARVETANAEAQRLYAQACESWDTARQVFEGKQLAQNRSVEARASAYRASEVEAIEDYCDVVLSSSTYPDSFPSEFQLEYRPEAKMLLVDYRLPAPEDLPRLREVRYIQSREEFKESFLTDAAFNRMYDSCLYQIALRTVRELFEADQISGIQVVLFNGWVTAVDPATGKPTTGCILSLQTNREEFEGIDLAQVDPKACFRSLKGVGSSKLHGLTPIRPILELNRDDSRFVNAREVADSLTEGDNLAAMDWEDFEHLIREVFEEEFAKGGGEVKITQASRDRGVDAVAFDPDPVRGGKIVIQAKRYTKTVGVSAVRDLFGTVMNEGAMKGILVSTSDYGPDAYEFARDKPLTLLSGANLLHMLAQHGHKARIDLQEARALFKEQEEESDGR